MTVRQRRTSPSVRGWAFVLGMSLVLHAAVLAGLALRSPRQPRVVALTVLDVNLAPPVPFARTAPAALRADDPPSFRPRAVALASTPSYAGASEAPSGESGDAVDLFGPVFADGLWPRPLLVRRDPCDPGEPSDAGDACRRELLLIGLATEVAAGAKAPP